MMKQVRFENWKFVIVVITAALGLLIANFSRGDTEDEAREMSRPLLTQNGKLFVLRLSPQSRRLDILTAGKTALVLDPSAITVFGKVFPVSGEPREFKVGWLSGHFQISEPIDASAPIELEVSDSVSSKTETFRFDSSTPSGATPASQRKNTLPIPVNPR